MVLQFQDIKGEIVAGAFRIVGLFNTENTPFDEANVFVVQDDVNQTFREMEILLMRFAIFLNDPEDLACCSDCFKRKISK